VSERQALESLQRRASLNNPGDREALIANPDALEFPPDQIAVGQVFVAERDGSRRIICRTTPLGHGIGRLLVEYCAIFARTGALDNRDVDRDSGKSDDGETSGNVPCVRDHAGQAQGSRGAASDRAR